MDLLESTELMDELRAFRQPLSTILPNNGAPVFPILLPISITQPIKRADGLEISMRRAR